MSVGRKGQPRLTLPFPTPPSQLQMQRKVQTNLHITRSALIPHPNETSYATPSPTTPPLSHSPPTSTFSYNSPDVSPLFFPSLPGTYAYQPHLYLPTRSPDNQRLFQTKTSDVAQWALDVAPPWATYDYACVAPLATGGTVGSSSWEAEIEWQRGLGLYQAEDPLSSGVGA